MVKRSGIFWGILAFLAVLFISGKTKASQVYPCPYGDNLTFTSLKDLQTHVELSHPDERIPIVVIWS